MDSGPAPRGASRNDGARFRVLAARDASEVCFYFPPLDDEGRRSAERRICNKPRLIPRIAGKQRHTATPPGAPPRRLKTLVRSSGDVADRRFRAAACPRPASLSGRPLSGPDGNPRPPETALARHVPRRRIRPAWVTPPRPSFRSVPLQARL